MENRKDIGKAINEKLSSLDKTPRDQVWSGISYELEKKKKRRFGFFFFWTKMIGLVIVASIATLYVYDHYYNGSAWFPSQTPKGRITIDSVNGESVTISPNNKNASINANEINAKTNQSNGLNDNSTTVNNNSNTNSGKDANNAIETNSRKNNEINGKNKANVKNAYSKSTLTNSKNGNAFVKSSVNSSIESSAKSSRKGNFNSGASKSGKSKSKLITEVGAKKTTKKSSKKNGTKSQEEKADKLLSENNVLKNNTSVVDLSSLQNKKSTNKTSGEKLSKKDSIVAQRQKEKELKVKVRDSLIAQKQKDKELKAKEKDSLIAQKQKDKVINIKMYPKDSVKVDSVIQYRKVQVDAFVSPTLYGYFSNASTLDRRLDSLTKKSEIKFSYGFGITYDLTKRLSVRIGYRKINLSYVTKNVPIDTDNYRGITYNPNISNETIFNAFNAIQSEIVYPETMDITQKISYTEIPLEIKYKFLDKKVGLKSSFGFSYLFLGDNKISIKTANGFSQDIGKTKNLASTAVSVNLGFEADYPLFKDTKIFVEPLFNYQFKAFSDGNYKPYVFGIHTGIRYTFNNK